MTSAGRSLSLFDLLCLGVNAIVGSGIYAFPGLLTGFLGPASFLAFVLAGSVSLLVAFCFAETSGGFDRSGGPYVYATSAFGGSVGYLVGWTCWAAALISWAAVSRALLPYLAQLWQPLGTGASGTLAAVGVVALMAGINYFGVKPGAITTDVLTIAKLLPLFVLTIVGIFKMRLSRLSPFAPHGLSKLPRAAFIAFFAYQGFEVVPVPAGESKDPKRNVPLAVIGSLLGATALYVIVQIVAVATTPGLAGAKQPLALMGTALLGGFGGKLVAAAAVISMLGFCSGVALASPRYIEALAQDRFLPAALAKRHSRWGTPTFAIALTSGVTALLVVVFDFGRLVDLSVLTVAVQYLATSASVPVLRRRGRTGKFRLPAGPLIPIVAFCVVLGMMVTQLVQKGKGSLTIAMTFGAMLLIGAVPALLYRSVTRHDKR